MEAFSVFYCLKWQTIVIWTRDWLWYVNCGQADPGLTLTQHKGRRLWWHAKRKCSTCMCVSLACDSCKNISRHWNCGKSQFCMLSRWNYGILLHSTGNVQNRAWVMRYVCMMLSLVLSNKVFFYKYSNIELDLDAETVRCLSVVASLEWIGARLPMNGSRCVIAAGSALVHGGLLLHFCSPLQCAVFAYVMTDPEGYQDMEASLWQKVAFHTCFRYNFVRPVNCPINSVILKYRSSRNFSLAMLSTRVSFHLSNFTPDFRYLGFPTWKYQENGSLAESDRAALPAYLSSFVVSIAARVHLPLCCGITWCSGELGVIFFLSSSHLGRCLGRISAVTVLTP